MTGAPSRDVDRRDISDSCGKVREDAAILSGNRNFDPVPHHDVTFPIVVAEWARNARDVVRVEIAEYNGRTVVAARTWYRNDEGVLKPGKSGITLAVKHLPALAAGLAKALERACELGLLDEGGAQ